MDLIACEQVAQKQHMQCQRSVLLMEISGPAEGVLLPTES